MNAVSILLKSLYSMPHFLNKLLRKNWWDGRFVLVNIANMDLLRDYTVGELVHGRFAFLCVCTSFILCFWH